MTTTTTAEVPTLDVDPFDEAHLVAPGPMHEQLREAGPVLFLSRYGVYASARFDVVGEALRNWQGLCSRDGVGLANFRREDPWRPPSLLLEADPPHHDAPRHVLSTLLTPRSLRRLREEWALQARRLVDDLLDGVPSGGVVELDGVPALAQAYPLRVFPDAVGLGEEGRENLLPYGSLLFNTFGPRNRLVEEALPRMGALATWVDAQCRREALRPGGLGEAIWAAADRGDLTHEQAPLVVRSLLSAGVDTTVHGLQAVLVGLSTHPVAWRALAEQPGLARAAYDEAVRWASPVQIFFRTARGHVDLAGTTIPDGEKLLLFYGAANRDPRHWADPDVYDLGRDPSGHVGFGFGLHQCVGQHVARLEGECLLQALAERVSHLEATAEATAVPNNSLRGFSSVPLRLTVR